MAAEQIETILAELGKPGSTVPNNDAQLIEASETITPFENLCARYIQNSDASARTGSAVNRIALEMDRDERVRKICRVQTLRTHCDLSEQEEIRQLTMERFFHSMLPKLRDADAVYAVVYATAFHVGRETFRDSHKLIINHDSIEEMLDRGEEVGQATLVDHEEVDLDLDIDTAAATKRMAIAFQKVLNGEQIVGSTGMFHLDQDPMVRIVQQTEEAEAAYATPQKVAATSGPTNPTLTPPKNTSRGHLSKDQQELVDIGADLLLRNQDYAFALGIGLPRLSSYIYGRTASVPDEVMKKARALKAEDPHLAERMNRYARPMSQILKEWEKQLQIKDDDENLAMCLGVTKMTIYRWRNDETKPDATALGRYEQFVRVFSERLNAIAKK